MTSLFSEPATRRLKVTALWPRLADYSHSLFRELATQHCDLQLVHHPPGGDLAFDDFDVSFCAQAIKVRSTPADLLEQVERFGPDVIFLTGWNIPGYLRIARQMRRTGSLVIAGLDNPWRGDLRQRVGCLAAPFLLKPAIDAFFAAGDSQVEFARRLGFQRSFRGLYCANVARFQGLPALSTRPHKFLYVGRLVERKGLRPMLQAYAQYRGIVTNPIPLVLAGHGELQAICEGRDGVELRGFVQPAHLPQLFKEAQCLLLPSFSEHWGVVLHEAAAAGLALIASDNCGASARFLQDGANGFLGGPDGDSLLQAMLAFHASSPRRLDEMSRISAALGLSWTPKLQAEQFMRSVRSLAMSRVRSN